jgi:hypothetical protein
LTLAEKFSYELAKHGYHKVYVDEDFTSHERVCMLIMIWDGRGQTFSKMLERQVVEGSKRIERVVEEAGK